MKKIVIFCICVLGLVGCGTQANYVKPETPAVSKDILVVIYPFQNNSADKSLSSIGMTLCDSIVAKMAGKKGFKVVERQKIETILKEMQLEYTGLMDESTCVKVGKMLGVNVEVMGSFTVFNKKIILTTRLIKLETGEILGSVKTETNDISNLDVLAENAAEKLTGALVKSN